MQNLINQSQKCLVTKSEVYANILVAHLENQQMINSHIIRLGIKQFVAQLLQEAVVPKLEPNVSAKIKFSLYSEMRFFSAKNTQKFNQD